MRVPGNLDRAILVRGDEGTADLYVYRSVADEQPEGAAAAPDFLKRNVVSAGRMAGMLPSLGINDKGSLPATSTNFGVGRLKWTQTLVVVFRNAEFLVAGIAYSAHDGLDPKGGGARDLNLLAGKGTRNGKAVTEKLPPIKLADRSDEKLPKACQF